MKVSLKRRLSQKTLLNFANELVLEISSPQLPSNSYCFFDTRNEAGTSSPPLCNGRCPSRITTELSAGVLEQDLLIHH
jgi:hypothetical protein